MKTATFRSSRFVAALLSVACASTMLTSRVVQGNGVPYGMDTTPQSEFYDGGWGFYSADPVPLSRGEHNQPPYGRAVIPVDSFPHLRGLHQGLPHPTLQVLTKAIEDDHARRAPSR